MVRFLDLWEADAPVQNMKGLFIGTIVPSSLAPARL